jgi:HlyD family secretion protein
MMRTLLLIVLCAAAGALGIYAFSLDKKEGEGSGLLVRVERRDFSVELNVIGVLDAAKSHMISSGLSGNQGKIIYLVDDGKKVEKDELLVKFDPLPFQKEVELLEAEVASFLAAVQAGEQNVAFERNQVDREIGNARYALNVAVLELKKLEEGEGPLQISQLLEEQQKARMELQKHERYYRDLLDLKKQGFDNVSEIDATREKVEVLKKQFDTATGRYDTYIEHVLPALKESARAKKANAELALEQIGQGGVHKIAKAEATLNQIAGKLQAKQAALQQARSELDKTEIVAPFSGIVILYETFRDGEKRKPREGDAVFMGQPVLYLPDISSMIVKTKAREIDLYKLALGQMGRVTVDAYPDTVFSGELVFIGALATTETPQSGGEKYFQVTFLLDGGDRRLRPGMTCRISITARTLTNVLAVPVQALFQEEGVSFCFVDDGAGGFEKREVTVGARNEDLAEIVQGLQEGEQVSLVRPGTGP